MENKPQDEYWTKDLGEAAAIYCKNGRLLRLQKEHNFFWFVFSDKELCKKLSDEYWFGDLLVNAKKYHDSLRTLKDSLFAKARVEGNGGK